MSVIFTLTTTVLALLPVCRSNYVGEVPNYKVRFHQILQKIESLETAFLECNRKSETLQQSQWQQENENRLQASKIMQLESRAMMMDANESKVKELEKKLNEAFGVIDKLVKEVEIIKLQRRLANTSSNQLQYCEKCEKHMQSQGKGHTNADKISGNREISSRISKLPRMKRFSGFGKTNVAFSVTMATWHELTLASHELLPFDVVSVNDGNGFDSNLKSFICPVTGIYFFTATITGYIHKFECYIVIDGEEKAVISTGDGPSFEQASSSVVSHCSKGQRVYIFTYNAATAIGYASGRFTVFSGFLITDLESVSS
ncbi:hypothetical protein CHS0354_042686 [Potamilus streckersoni]|uniref:C1q domain-containing protein n=1 Tax=Potamilus streckersoni TaxID=2493646 RepID=A0AAE0VST5_9BIVA|nr:hypothetical protein CHS0354_042686 [Potamilus streckersoni]